MERRIFISVIAGSLLAAPLAAAAQPAGKVYKIGYLALVSSSVSSAFRQRRHKPRPAPVSPRRTPGRVPPLTRSRATSRRPPASGASTT